VNGRVAKVGDPSAFIALGHRGSEQRRDVVEVDGGHDDLSVSVAMFAAPGKGDVGLTSRRQQRVGMSKR
jgi:hypothetical protein